MSRQSLCPRTPRTGLYSGVSTRRPLSRPVLPVGSVHDPTKVWDGGLDFGLEPVGTTGRRTYWKCLVGKLRDRGLPPSPTHPLLVPKAQDFRRPDVCDSVVSTHPRPTTQVPPPTGSSVSDTQDPTVVPQRVVGVRQWVDRKYGHYRRNRVQGRLRRRRPRQSVRPFIP